MRLAVIGSRTFEDKQLLESTLATLSSRLPDIGPVELLVSGGAKGADSLAEEYADSHQIEKLIIKPDYKRYPAKVAPLKRNETIVDHAEVVVAFWDGKSKGTKNAVDYAKRKGKKVVVITF